MSWQETKESFESFVFPEDKFRKAVEQAREQDRIISKGTPEEVEEMKSRKMVTVSTRAYSVKDEKKPNIKKNVVNIGKFDGYNVDCWEVTNDVNLIERGCVVFNDKENECKINKIDYKSSGVTFR